jgi:glycosyltransferase involved in cell wall biosynthesis
MNEIIEGSNVSPEMRTIQEGDAPAISVVVASCREMCLLDACLKSLLLQCSQHKAEIVVARACNKREIKDLTGAYPSVRFLPAPVDSTIPYLRAVGIEAAKGDVVALTEDHCVVATNWVTQLVNAQQEGTDVVGGAMDNAQRDRVVDWAAYFAEYGFFAENAGSQTTEPLLTGANVAYSRRVVDEVVTQMRQGEWETVVHAHLAWRGDTLQFLRTASVFQNKNYRFWEFCQDRFVHGRDFARRRLVDDGPKRWLYFTGSLILPVVLTVRVARAGSCGHRWSFLRALPVTFAFLTAWAVGEAVGYCYGPAQPGTGNA